MWRRAVVDNFTDTSYWIEPSEAGQNLIAALKNDSDDANMSR